MTIATRATNAIIETTAAAAPSPRGKARKAASRPGMILAFTLAMLILMSLMGIVILSNTRTELNVTGNTRLGREAFNTADNCARIATFLTLALLNPRTDDINDAIETMLPSPPPDFPVEIELTPKFTMANLLSEATNFDYRKRYLETGAGPSNADPHIIFKVNGREVANAVVNVETYRLIPEGMSLGTGDPNDATGGARLSVGVIVSVAAKANTPAGASTAPAPPASPSAPVAPAAAANPSEPGSIVTIMYKNNLG